MDSLLIGGRCEKHLSPKPCAKCLAEYRAEPRDLDHKGVLRLLHQFIGDGTQKAAAERMGVSQQYLSDVLNENREPGALILDALGLERVVSYRPTRGVATDQLTKGGA